MGKVKFLGYARRSKRVPFAITYHPSLKNIGRIINENLHILYMNEEVKKPISLHQLQ